MSAAKIKVLVVDDEIEIVEFLERFLDRFSITVFKALTAVKALELFQAESPEWVLLDVMLPDKDGITVLKEMKKINNQVKVIMVTGKEEKTFQDKAKKAGAIDYITKPLDLSELSQKIENLL